MPRTLLLRVYIDTNLVYGGYYSPLHEECCPTLLPIKETSPLRKIPLHLNAVELVDECTGNSLSTFYPKEWVIDGKLPVHNDPRPDLGFYTGHRVPRGRIPKSLRRGDYILFMAGLARYPKNFWDRPRRRIEIIRAFREVRSKGYTGIYLVAYIKVKEIVDVATMGWSTVLSKYPILRYSPHYYRVNDKPVAVIGESGYFIPPIKLYDQHLGKPTKELIELIGRDNAWKLMRNNFRKTRLIEKWDPSIIGLP